MLRGPKTTAVLLGCLTGVIGLALLLPQHPQAEADSWISALPGLLQPWGILLFTLSLNRIFQSAWFWLPVALLLLNSLVALADYTPAAWNRFHKNVPPLEWQHPLAYRAEQVSRLPGEPDLFLETLQASLEQAGFSVSSSQERIIGAVRRSWAWLAPSIGYGGVLLLILAFLVSFFSLKVERFILWPAETTAAPSIAPGQFQLIDFETPAQVRLEFREQTTDTLRWSLYRPAWVQGVLFLPTATEPVLTIDIRDESDTPVKIMPPTQEAPPLKQLSLPLNRLEGPIYFSIPSARLAVRMEPDSASEMSYQLQVRQNDESNPSITRMIAPDQAVAINNLTLRLSRNQNLHVIAYRDLAWPIYFVSLVLVGMGVVFTFWRPPLQVWLVPEVRGLGGQLYGVAETLGSQEKAAHFLEQLLPAKAETE